jgi:glucose dehydrogenase
MSVKRLALTLCVCGVMVGGGTEGPHAQSDGSPTVKTGDWPLHNLDIGNRRFSPLDQINVSNVAKLVQRWTYALPRGVNAGSQTPLVVGGIMYISSGSKLMAINAATGEQKWIAEVQPAFLGGGRGPAYGDGVVYAFGPSRMYAIDAATGKPLQSFGENGVLRIVNKALDFKDPGKYPRDLDPETIGYSMTTPPSYHNGTLYVAVPFADSLINGGLVIAANSRTGDIKWVFRTVPQGPKDDGWELAKDTWRGSPKRQGGGIWTTPAIDPDLGIIYVNASNPSPNYDGSSRKGANLFTNSLVALNLTTGKLLWHYQVIHHDIWDWDLVTGPTLFDVTVNGRTIKGVGSLAKTCYAYLLNRDTGQPINPMVESPMITATDVPGEEVSPTQPIPYTSRGIPQQPFCATYPKVSDPELAKLVRPSFHPYLVNDYVIISPGLLGGPNYGPSSFSPRTGLLYVTGKNDASSIKVKPVGDSVEAGPGSPGHFKVFTEIGKTGVTATQNVVAYEPASGNQAWSVELPGTTGTGNFVTAGDVLVQAVGRDLYAFDARTGKQLFKTTLTAPSRSTPMTYGAQGTQYIALVVGSSVIAYGLP